MAIVFAVVIAALALLLFGSLAIVGGGVYWLRIQHAEMRRAEVQKRLNLARNLKRHGDAMHKATASSLHIEIGLAGELAFEGEPIQLEEIEARLLVIQQETESDLTVHIHATQKRCTAGPWK